METVKSASVPRQSAAKWKEHIETQRASGQSIKEWCVANEVSLKQFYHWRKKLGGVEEESSGGTQQIVKVPQEALEGQERIAGGTHSRAKKGSRGASSASSDKTPQEPVIRIHVGGYEIEVPTEVGESELAKVMRAVKNAW